MTKPPPDPTPSQSASEQWDDMIDDVVQSGVSPAVAKAMLAMNPNLRQQGLDTMGIMKRSQNVAKPAAGAPAQAPPTVKQGVFELLSELARTSTQDEASIDAQIAALQKQKADARAVAVRKVEQWLLANDPDVLSPVTQSALSDLKAFLDRVGFSVKTYVSKHRARK